MASRAEAARRKMRGKDKQISRQLEIKQKITLLKGGRAARYKKERDEAEGKKGGREEEEEGEEGEEGSEASPAQQSGEPRSRDRDYEGGGTESYWGWDREEQTGPKEKKASYSGSYEVSEEARAIANTELNGRGGKASARSVLDAAMELVSAREKSDAAQLLEIARTRIDSDQINRIIDNSEAQAMDRECMWELSDLYEQQGLLTLACARFWELRNLLPEGRGRRSAEQRWAKANFVLAENLYKANRFEDSLQVLVNIKETTTKQVNGDMFMEKAELYEAMALQKLKRMPEAEEILMRVKKTSGSRKRRKQAEFILDVQLVGEQVTRNDEMHEIWDNNWKQTMGAQTQVRIGGGVRAMTWLSPRERAFKEWAADYWESRLKSPAYYAFLTLWVTWPFAIPVVSILKKGGTILPP